MSANKVIIYPFLKKKNGKVDVNNVNQDDVEAIVDHYLVQFIDQLKIHGFPLHGMFITDFHFAEQFMKAAVLRTVGIHHRLQDAVEEMVEENRISSLGSHPTEEELNGDDN